MTTGALAHQLVCGIRLEHAEEAKVENPSQILDDEIELFLDHQQVFVVSFIVICALIFFAFFSFIELDLIVVVLESIGSLGLCCWPEGALFLKYADTSINMS